MRSVSALHLTAVAFVVLFVTTAPTSARTGVATVPRFQHIFVIVEENKSASHVVGSVDAPHLTGLAHRFGLATNFYAETHPSEPNYVAMIGGYTYGIQDDDAYYCHPADTRANCDHASTNGYADHTIHAPDLGTQLLGRRLRWKNYNESIPGPGSLAVSGRDPDDPGGPPVYASKHSGFINFDDVQRSPQRAQELVGFRELYEDLRSNSLPAFALIVPNLCNDMHGMGRASPADCQFQNSPALIHRGDDHAQMLVDAITATRSWRSSDRDAIVVTFDEDDGQGKEGCCGVDPRDPANAGGGRVATIVITNHGPRGMVDATPYSHYSLLRTIEDAFGITTHLRQANAVGVQSMVRLFSDRRKERKR